MSEILSFNDLAHVARQRSPVVALTLGSGLSALMPRLKEPYSVPFALVPGLCATSVAGHAGRLTHGIWAGNCVLVFEGRLHYYEGHPWTTVMMPARIARDLGCRVFLATNAAGGIRADLSAGSLMLLRGHIDWARPGLCQEPVTAPYSPRLNALLQEAAGSVSLASGVYAQVTGPCYETPAEIRALRSLGADAVGMSTAREIVAAHEFGLQCAAVSCISNRAAGLNQGPIHHSEVLTSMAATSGRLGDLLERFMQILDRHDSSND
jgi:purine-nucleoside phosphorylase